MSLLWGLNIKYTPSTDIVEALFNSKLPGSEVKKETIISLKIYRSTRYKTKPKKKTTKKQQKQRRQNKQKTKLLVKKK